MSKRWLPFLIDHHQARHRISIIATKHLLISAMKITTSALRAKCSQVTDNGTIVSVAALSNIKLLHADIATPETSIPPQKLMEGSYSVQSMQRAWSEIAKCWMTIHIYIHNDRQLWSTPMAQLRGNWLWPYHDEKRHRESIFWHRVDFYLLQLPKTNKYPWDTGRKSSLWPYF